MGVIDRLNDPGTTVLAADSILSGEVIVSFGATPALLSDPPNRAVDTAVAVMPHKEFGGIDWATFDDLVIVDDRGTLDDIDHRVYEIGGGPQDESSETRTGPETTAGSSHGGPG